MWCGGCGQRFWGKGGGVVLVEMSVWLSMNESEEKTNEKAWGALMLRSSDPTTTMSGLDLVCGARVSVKEEIHFVGINLLYYYC